MRSDNLLTLLVVCVLAYCLPQVRIAAALERALSLAEPESQRRAEAENRMAEQMRREEAKERLDAIKRLEAKRSSPTAKLTERRIKTTRAAFEEMFAARPHARILVEASTESEWVTCHLELLGHEVIVGDPNFAPMYATLASLSCSKSRALCRSVAASRFIPFTYRNQGNV